RRARAAQRSDRSSPSWLALFRPRRGRERADRARWRGGLGRRIASRWLGSGSGLNRRRAALGEVVAQARRHVARGALDPDGLVKPSLVIAERREHPRIDRFASEPARAEI